MKVIPWLTFVLYVSLIILLIPVLISLFLLSKGVELHWDLMNTIGTIAGIILTICVITLPAFLWTGSKWIAIIYTLILSMPWMGLVFTAAGFSVLDAHGNSLAAIPEIVVGVFVVCIALGIGIRATSYVQKRSLPSQG